MSTSYEVPIEPLVSDGSNYASWSIQVCKHLRKLGPLAEWVVVASILPPNFSWKNVDITNQREMDCMQLNALVTDYLLSYVCAEINDIILEDEEMRENAHLIWKFLKNLCDKDCSVPSVISTAYQKSSDKSWEDKVTETSDLTPEITANPEVPDSEPRSSGLENNAEIYQSNDESASNGSAQSHYGNHQCFVATAEDNTDLDIDNGSNCDSDDDDEELMLELRKVSKKSRETILGLMKKVMKQDQEIKKQKKVLNKKDDEIKCLALVEERNHDLKTQVDELTNKLMYKQTRGMEVKCSNERLMDSLATLEIAHEQVIVEDCNDDLALENEVLKQEVERLSQDLSKLKGKSVVQPSQDNRATMVKKLEKGSTVQNSCNLIHKSKESKSQTKKKDLAHVKCFKCSKLGHYASMCSNMQKARKLSPSVKEVLPKEDVLAAVKWDTELQLAQTSQANPERKAVKDNKNKPSNNIKHKVCYTCREKLHLGKDCPNGNSPKPNSINNVPLYYRRPSNGVGAGRMTSSSTTRPRAIWVPKSLLTNLRGPNLAWVLKCA
ncbi:hypothetical protein PVAP13_8KG231300 [Panicum virgatum]|uniref:CCHC-type domain-containing protein n=1 Tax=Panicum virgatum TaxID=38727 RepID=A0A8T0PUW3_PANVG|nr:hypothetical protein PVAP13_8KG231300 [Panicum virgatum]